MCSADTLQICAVYHKFAACEPFQDMWSRRYIHGLDFGRLYQHGFTNEQELLCDFKSWLSQFNVQDIYANNCVRERQLLNMNVKDVGLPNWVERVKHRYHNIPQFCKKYGQPIFNVICDEDNHRIFQRRDILPSMKLCDKLKYAHGYHCSLADVYELYLFYEQLFDDV